MLIPITRRSAEENISKCTISAEICQALAFFKPISTVEGIEIRCCRDSVAAMAFSATEDINRRLLRARDAMDRCFADPLDVPMLARIALMSPAHFIRSFKATFGEPPHQYLQRRRVERAMALLRESQLSVTEVAFQVGFASVGTFSRTFKTVLGESPSAHRLRAVPANAPGCFVRTWTRPSALAGHPASRQQPSSFG